MHYCVPGNVLGNEELAARFGERQIASISKMSGVVERRVVSPGITASDLAYCAATRLILEKAIAPESIDALIFTSQTGDYQIPATACVLHERLGLYQHCASFDVGLGCSGFPYSLSIAQGLICSGLAKRVLLLNADALTTVIHPEDRGLVPLHGDGAVATLLDAGDTPGIGLVFSSLGTDGTGAKHLCIPASGARLPRSEETKLPLTEDNGVVRTKEHLCMNGPAIFHFSIYKVPEVVQGALAAMGIGMDAVDLVILHQANKMMIDQIYKALGVAPEKRFCHMEKLGNMSGASSPMVLAEAWRQGRIQPGSLTLVIAFGVGLSWGLSAIRWPDPLPSPVTASVDYETV